MAALFQCCVTVSYIWGPPCLKGVEVKHSKCFKGKHKLISQDYKMVSALGGQVSWPYCFSVMLQCQTSGDLQVRRLLK